MNATTNKAEWTVYLITDTGRKVPHWTCPTRERARSFVRRMGPTPAGVQVRIERGV